MQITVHEQGLADTIVSAWHGNFAHSYVMPNRRGPVAASWIDWQLRHGKSKTKWECKSLSQAATQYAWDAVEASKQTNNYWNCREKLLSAIENEDSAAAAAACYQIFKWGGVAKRPDDVTRKWVEKAATNGDLISEIVRAIHLLTSSADPSQHFGRDSLLMNSAVTKIYSIGDANNGLPIYDGRVGAALGILVVHYCRKNSLNVVPNELWDAIGIVVSRKRGRKITKMRSVTGQPPLPAQIGNDQPIPDSRDDRTSLGANSLALVSVKGLRIALSAHQRRLSLWRCY